MWKMIQSKKSSLTQISIQSSSSLPWGDYTGQDFRLKSQWQQRYAIHSHWSYLNVQLYCGGVHRLNSPDSECVEELMDAKQTSLILPLSAVWYDMIRYDVIYWWIADIKKKCQRDNMLKWKHVFPTRSQDVKEPEELQWRSTERQQVCSLCKMQWQQRDGVKRRTCMIWLVRPHALEVSTEWMERCLIPFPLLVMKRKEQNKCVHWKHTEERSSWLGVWEIWTFPKQGGSNKSITSWLLFSSVSSYRQILCKGNVLQHCSIFILLYECTKMSD